MALGPVLEEWLEGNLKHRHFMQRRADKSKCPASLHLGGFNANPVGLVEDSQNQVRPGRRKHWLRVKDTLDHGECWGVEPARLVHAKPRYVVVHLIRAHPDPVLDLDSESPNRIVGLIQEFLLTERGSQVDGLVADVAKGGSREGLQVADRLVRLKGW